jgi:hypothetical protein
VDEVAASVPFVDLRVGQVCEDVVPLFRRQPLAEHQQARHVDAVGDLLDRGLFLVGVGLQQLVEVPERNVAVDVLGVQGQRAKRLGHEVEAQAVLNRREGGVERFTA